MQCVNLIVVGECGDGKSTLINALRNPDMAEAASCGRCPTGVTKEISLYRCKDLSSGKALNLVDTPGVGDGTITVTQLVGLIEQALSSGTVPGGIHGVLVTTPIPDCRVKLGAQIVQTIVNKGFMSTTGADKYASIILVGTKADKAEKDEKENFMHGEDGEKGVRELFFRDAKPPGQGKAVMVHRGDYGPLLRAIEELPEASIRYEAPAAPELAGALAEKLGLNAEDMQGELASVRRIIQEQSGQIKELMRQMFESEERHREEIRRREEQAARLQDQMRMDREAWESRQEKQRLQFERMRQEEREDAMRRLEADERRRESEQARQDQVLRELRSQMESMTSKHNDSMRAMQRSHSEALAAASQNSKNGGGVCVVS